MNRADVNNAAAGGSSGNDTGVGRASVRVSDDVSVMTMMRVSATQQ